VKTASAALIALLESNQFRMADIYTITLAIGTVYRYADYDADLLYGGNVYASDDLMISRSGSRTVAGLEVDTLSVEIFADDTHLMLGIPFLQMARNGGLDGATMLVERVFMPMDNPIDTSAGTLHVFSGRINVDEVLRGVARLSVVSDIELLNVQMPRNIYQPGCSHTLFDTGCGLSKAATVVPGTVAAGSTVRSINCDLADASGFFTLGTIEFTSGANAGVIRTVASYAPGVVGISLPLVVPPAAGDTFNAYPGCDKKQATCSAKFSNLIRFRGFPYIPIPETAI